MRYEWNLEIILEEKPLDWWISKFFEELEKIVDLFKAGPFSSLEKLIEFHKNKLEIKRINNKISNYISNNMNVDLSNDKWFALSQEIECKSIHFWQEMADFNEEVIKNKEKIIEYLKDPVFSKYKKTYQDIFDSEKHQLKPDIKKFMQTFVQLNSSFYSLFTLIFDKELVVEDAADAKNKKHKIDNYAIYQKNLKSPDRKLRKNTYINWNIAVHKFRDTFARLMYYNFLEFNIDAKNHKFPKGYYESVLFEDEINQDLIPFIYKKVESWNYLVSKYFKINKKIIKHNYLLSKVEAWDLYMPIFNNNEKFSIEEAKDIVWESLKILGPDYQEDIKKSFEDQSIDWLPRKNKTSGAYCIGNCWGIGNKYVFLNYNHSFDDILTVGHELGHAIHAKHFCKTQDHYASTSIFIAEIPSTLNEILINKHFLNKYKSSNDKANLKKQLEIYDNLISTFINTTSSQIVFSAWEYEVNNKILENHTLTADEAESLYREKQIQYFDIKKKKMSDIAKKSLTKILTVPHFYCGNFYVYKYAVGMVVAVYLSENINEEFLPKYFEFLSSGSSKSNLDTIKLLGISLDDEMVWDVAHKALKKWMSEYSRIYNILYAGSS